MIAGLSAISQEEVDMFEVGSVVAYSPAFLKQLGVSATDKSWTRKGEIKGHHSTTYVRVHWENEEEPRLVRADTLSPTVHTPSKSQLSATAL